MLTIYYFLRMTKAKAYIFLGLCAYFLFSLCIFFPFVPELIQNSVGYLFVPALIIMYSVMRFFDLGGFAHYDGKGPEPSDAVVAYTWIFAFFFGIFILYLVACAFGMWYESAHRRVRGKMDSRLRGNDNSIL